MDDNRIKEIIYEEVNNLLISEGIFGNETIKRIKEIKNEIENVLASMNKGISLTHIVFKQPNDINEARFDKGKKTLSLKDKMRQNERARKNAKLNANRKVQNTTQVNNGQPISTNQQQQSQNATQVNNAQSTSTSPQQQSQNTTQVNTAQTQVNNTQPTNANQQQQSQNTTQTNTTQTTPNLGVVNQGGGGGGQPPTGGIPNQGQYQQQLTPQQQEIMSYVPQVSRIWTWGKNVLGETVNLLKSYLDSKGVKEGKLYEADGTQVNPMDILRGSWGNAKRGFMQGYKFGNFLNRYKKNVTKKEKFNNFEQRIKRNIEEYEKIKAYVTKYDFEINSVKRYIVFGEEISEDIDKIVDIDVRNMYKELKQMKWK